MFDVFEPLGLIFPSLTHDQFVEAVIPWVGEVDGDAPLFNLDGIIEEHVEKSERDRTKPELFDADGLFVSSSSFRSKEFEFQFGMLKEDRPVRIVAEIKPNGFKNGLEIHGFARKKRPWDKEINIDGFERKTLGAKMFLIHKETPTADEFQAIFPKTGLVKGFENVFNDVLLHVVFPSEDGEGWRATDERP